MTKNDSGRFRISVTSAESYRVKYTQADQNKNHLYEDEIFLKMLDNIHAFTSKELREKTNIEYFYINPFESTVNIVTNDDLLVFPLKEGDVEVPRVPRDYKHPEKPIFPEFF